MKSKVKKKILPLKTAALMYNYLPAILFLKEISGKLIILQILMWHWQIYSEKTMKPFLFWKLCRKFKKTNKKKLYFCLFLLKHKVRKAGLLLLEKIEMPPSTTIKTGLHIHVEQEDTSYLMALKSPFALFLFKIFMLQHLPSSPPLLNKVCFSTQAFSWGSLMALSLPHAVSEGLISVFRCPRLAWDSKMFEGTEQILNIL